MYIICVCVYICICVYSLSSIVCPPISHHPHLLPWFFIYKSLTLTIFCV